MSLPSLTPTICQCCTQEMAFRKSSCCLHSQQHTRGYLTSFNSLSFFVQKKKFSFSLASYITFPPCAFMKFLLWKRSLPRQLLFEMRGCMGLDSLHLTLFNFHSGVRKTAVSIMHSMFPDREDCRHSKYPSKPSFSSTKHVVCSIHTSAELPEPCHYCFSIIMFYNPPLHTRAQFTSSYNALASSSNPLVVSQAPQHHSLLKIFYY